MTKDLRCDAIDQLQPKPKAIPRLSRERPKAQFVSMNSVHKADWNNYENDVLSKTV